MIGNAVGHVFAEIQKKINVTNRTGEDMKTQVKGNLFSRLCGFVAGCMTPLLPAMLGCGMLKVILTLLTLFEVLDPLGSTAGILNIAGDSFFCFLPIMLAYTAAQKMGTSPFLAMIVAAIMLHPNLPALFAAGKVSYFGLPVTETVYSSSVLPILLMVPIMKYIERVIGGNRTAFSGHAVYRYDGNVLRFAAALHDQSGHIWL